MALPIILGVLGIGFLIFIGYLGFKAENSELKTDSKGNRLTQYRSYFDGHKYFLQYYETGLFGDWKNVWKPYYDEFWGRSLDTLGNKCNVTSYNEKDLKNFIERYPDIQVYFAESELVQAKLEADVNKKRAEREASKGKIKNLN